MRNISRRDFLVLLAATAPGLATGLAAGDQSGAVADRSPRVGIALGAGGANGLAHILMLEALDEMDIRPHRVSGSSIGAVIGAMYASGMTGRAIHRLVDRFLISSDEGVFEQLADRDALRWMEFIEIELGSGGLVSSQGFLSFVYETIHKDDFESLNIPLSIAAADFWEREPVRLDAGPLLPAISASMALPGVFQPVVIGDRVLVDGGTVNPVPYDLLDDCEVVIAVDVIGERSRAPGGIPGYFETIFNSAKIMQKAIMAEKLRRRAPDIYIRPRIVDVRALEFYKAEQVFGQAAPAKRELKRRLRRLLKAHPSS
ncbi:MAG: patatin-like phospholipase family protein [Gammaproteobacteria bacterium]|jgi:NTE family protein